MKLRLLKTLLLSALVCFLALSLCACHSSSTADSLYRLPHLPPEYDSLEAQINELLASGAERTAPTSGSNLQSVQMVDLDGDDVEEAIAFFRKPTDDKPMKIYFFRSNGEAYEPLAMIEGTASSLYSIAYADLNGDKTREILIGYKSGTDLQVLSVYTLRGNEPHNLLTTAYTRYALGDMDGDAQQEVCLLYSNEDNLCMADCYTFTGAELALKSTITLSFPSTQLQNVSMGTLSGGEPVLFLTGVSDNSVAVTDILALQDGILKNVTRNASGEISRFLNLYPSDVNNDGITEVPEPVAFATEDEEGEVYYSISWRQYTLDGPGEILQRSFHNEQDGWTLVLQEAWNDAVVVRRTVLSNESCVTFSYLRGNDSPPLPFLALYTLTGDDREYRASRGERFLLARQVDTLYAAEFLSADAKEQIGEQALRDSFSLIMAEWTTGEN